MSHKTTPTHRPQGRMNPPSRGVPYITLRLMVTYWSTIRLQPSDSRSDLPFRLASVLDAVLEANPTLAVFCSSRFSLVRDGGGLPSFPGPRGRRLYVTEVPDGLRELEGLSQWAGTGGAPTLRGPWTFLRRPQRNDS